jgi:hypothetical protein
MYSDELFVMCKSGESNAKAFIVIFSPSLTILLFENVN